VHLFETARRIARDHDVALVGHWDTERRDWLRASTVFSPRPMARTVEGILIQRMGMPTRTRLRMLPWMATYYAQIGRSADRLAGLMLPQLEAVAGPADVVHNHRVGREFLSLASERLARRRRIPFVLTPYHHPRWTGWRYRPYLALYRRADLLCVMTRTEGQALERLGVDPARLLVVGSAPEVAGHADARAFRQRLQLEDQPLVLFLGQKYAYKGIDTLLKAAPQVWRGAPETRFVFVGPRTPYSRRLFARVDPRVMELDAVDQQEKANALAAATILCLPSSQESFGMVFLEAWTMGTPVIGGRIPAVSELIDDGGDGLLVTPGNVGELTSALDRLLASPELRDRLGRTGQAKVARQFSWDRCARIQLEAYERLRSDRDRAAKPGQDLSGAGLPGELP